MPKLNQIQKLLLFFVAGVVFGILTPIAGIIIAVLMLILRWEDILIKP